MSRRGEEKGSGLHRRHPVADDVDREIRAHVGLRAEELMEKGWDEESARQEAWRRFGDRERVAREMERIARRQRRQERGRRMMGALWQDLRYGMRAFFGSPGFTLIAVVTLALGIGANTAVFSVVHGVLLEPLPYEDSGELVWVSERSQRGGTMAVAWANYRDWREESSSFEALTAYGVGTSTILGGERPVRARLANVSQDMWDVFGVRPVRGRLTVDADHDAAAEPVMVVGEAFWRDELGGGELEAARLEYNGRRYRVVGVVPASFEYPAGTELWAPLELLSQSDSRTAHNWRVVGRLAEGVTVERAAEEMDALTRRLVEREPDPDWDFLAVGAQVVPLRDQVVGSARTPLYLLLGAAGLVLLVACTNLASTLLARGTARARELAVRRSLGAGQVRIVRQLLTESLLLAGLGGAAGAGLAALAVQGLKALGPTSVPRLAEVGVDGTVLGFTAVVAVCTALLFGLWPALRLTRDEAGDALRAGSRGNAGDRGRGTWPWLIGTEVALAMVLLVGSGLLGRSLQQLLDEDAGFDGSDVASASVVLSRVKYETAQDQARWYAGFIRQLESTPGISAAGVISSLPAGGSIPNGRMELDGDMSKHAQGQYVVASAGAFQALDIGLVRGRLFDERDGPDDAHVAIVNEAFAREFWPGEDPVGRQVTGGGMDNFWEDRAFATVVGVVADVRYRGLGREAAPTVYFPYSQRPFRIQYGANVVVEADGDGPGSVIPSVRDLLQRLDPDVPVRITPMETLVGASLAQQRFLMTILGGFSLTALLLAVVGIYGVVSYSVARRTREMGIRLALGADPGSVRAMVVKGSMSMVVGGLVVGVLGSLGLARVMSGFLYQVSPQDPTTLAGAALILVAAAFAASWLPAWSGTRVDPMVTMREE